MKLQNLIRILEIKSKSHLALPSRPLSTTPAVCKTKTPCGIPNLVALVDASNSNSPDGNSPERSRQHNTNPSDQHFVCRSFSPSFVKDILCPVVSQLRSAHSNASWLYARRAFGSYCHHRPQGMQSLEGLQLFQCFKMEVPSNSGGYD